ncbi:MAG: hypothetical protein JJE52_17035 [Acidimicrobiia bacterium]|nr:hypothetical protein [Acidimicrobiia bacterium]
MHDATAGQLNRDLSQRLITVRYHAGLDRRTRLNLQLQRDDQLACIDQVDAQLAALAGQRQALVSDAHDLHDRLWPVVPWKKGRRPPRLDQTDLPPVVHHPIPLFGRRLRSVCLTILARHGAQRLRDLHGLLHLYGFVIAAEAPVRVLADALGYEHDRQRAQRVRRGVYALHPGFRPRRGRHGRVDLPPMAPLHDGGSSGAGSGVDPGDPSWVEPTPEAEGAHDTLGAPNPAISGRTPRWGDTST